MVCKCEVVKYGMVHQTSQIRVFIEIPLPQLYQNIQMLFGFISLAFHKPKPAIIVNGWMYPKNRIMRIEDEIQQQTFLSEYHKANINLFYTQAWMQLKIIQALKPFNISPQQFNILRILRGRHPKPASIRELTDRMLDKSSNASRLVDKLLAKGFVEKSTSKKDNRKMEVNITEQGLQMLKQASAEVEHCISEVFGVLSEEEATSLNNVLDKIRG